MHVFKHILILTGAGLSAESGISTFRDETGIWSQYDYRDVATPDGFARNPMLVQDFYNNRRRGLKGIKPNAAHLALAHLERDYPGDVTIVTQNIDHLHEEAGSHHVIHMHGELLKALCTRCGNRHPWHDDIDAFTPCPTCGRPGHLRPDVVWFGEMPYQMERITTQLAHTDLFISIGTSGNVYPAAGFVAMAHDHGAHTVELNLEPSEGATLFDETIHGPATSVVPAYVERLLKTLSSSAAE